MRTGFLIIALTAAASASAFEPPTAPPAVAGVRTIDAEKLIELAQRPPDLLMIDSRIAGNRKHGYIEGSISLPDVATDCDSLARTIPALDTQVLFYCNGIKCGRSAKAVTVARDCGYQALYWFRGGFEEWKEKGYPFLRD